MRMLILRLCSFLTVALLATSSYAVTVQVSSGGVTLATLTSVVQDPENGNKRTIFLSTPPSVLPSGCAGTARTFTTASGARFTFDDFRGAATAACPAGTIAVSSTTGLKQRARVYVDNSNPSVPKIVLVGRVTANFSGSSSSVAVTFTSGSGDFATASGALAYGTGVSGTFRRSGPSTDPRVIVPTNNSISINGTANAASSPNVINNPDPLTAPLNSLSTADPPSASIPPAAFKTGASCTGLTTKVCTASFNIADAENNIACGTPCPSTGTTIAITFVRNGDIVDFPGSGKSAFGRSIGQVVRALEQCNQFSPQPPVLNSRIQFTQPTPGNNFGSGQSSIAFKAEDFAVGGDFLLASPISEFYVAIPGSVVDDTASFVTVTPGTQPDCAPIGPGDITSLQATYSFNNNTDCRFSSYRFEMLLSNGQTARGMFGKRSGQYFGSCAAPNQSGLDFVTNAAKNWQLDDGPFQTFASLVSTLVNNAPDAKLTELRLVLDQGLNTDENAGTQLVKLDTLSVGVLGNDPFIFAPPPAGQETQITGALPLASALITQLATGQSLVVPESAININQSQWVFQVGVSSLFGPGDYEARMCLAQFCPNESVSLTIFGTPSQ